MVGNGGEDGDKEEEREKFFESRKRMKSRKLFMGNKTKDKYWERKQYSIER